MQEPPVNKNTDFFGIHPNYRISDFDENIVDPFLVEYRRNGNTATRFTKPDRVDANLNS